MDQDRQIRYLIPPFFFLASLLLGAYCGGKNLSYLLKPDDMKEILGVLAAAAVAVLPLGFLSGTISIVMLRIGARLRRWPTYETYADNATLARVWKQIHAPAAVQDPKLMLYTIATFDHEILHPGIHTWIMRRWNAFNICVSSCVALIGAQLVGLLLLSIPETAKWLGATIAAVAVFTFTAIDAWHHVMKMIEFQSHRHQEGSASSAQTRANKPLQPTSGEETG